MKRISGILVVLVLLVVCAVLLPTRAQAASESDLTFKLNSDGESYSVSDCNSSASGELVIPETYNGKPVTHIGNYAFRGCTGLTSVTIPDSVTTIGVSAFDSCSSLTSITIPDSVTTIGGQAFRFCEKLTSITIPDSVTEIVRDTFYDCTGLTNVTIGNSVTSIGYAAFQNCTSLSSITIPDNVTSIGYYAFSCCESLTSINIPDSVTSIGQSSFQFCTGLKSITIGNGVTSIGNSAFYGCTSLTDVYITDPSAWCKITGTQNINTRDVDVHILDAEGNEVTEVVLDDSVTIISSYAFKNCKNLTSITIPDSVTSIGNSAFEYCSNLTSITIPDSVTSIGGWAFSSCSRLTSIIYYGTPQQWGLINIGTGNNALTNATRTYQTKPPAAPELENLKSQTVTLKKVDGCEYSKDGTTWQSSNVFTNLSPNTTYTFYARLVDASTDYASGKSEGLTVTTPKNTVPAPAAPTLQIRTNSTITINPTSGCEYSIDGVNWQASNTFTGLKEYTTYTLYQRYVETNTDYASANSVGLTVTTYQISTITPAAPIVAYKNASTIILQKLDGYEYSLGGTTWQDSNEFAGLNPHTEYSFYQRVKETDTTYASVMSPALNAKTAEKSACSIKPAAPIVADYTTNKIVLVARAGYEYKIGNGSWTTSNTFTGLSANTSYTVYQRIAETTEEYASAASTGVTVKTARVVSGITTNTNYLTLQNYILRNGYTTNAGRKCIEKTYTYSGTTHNLIIIDATDGLWFTLESEKGSTSSDVSFTIYSDKTTIKISGMLITGTDVAMNSIMVDRTTISKNSYYNLPNGGTFSRITAAEASEVFSSQLQVLFALFEEFYASTLGFGMKGLGFLSYSGYGVSVCDPLSNNHISATTETRNVRSATCTIDGYTGDVYCTNCGGKVRTGSTIAANGSHSYSNSCDKDCNICGEERIVTHTYFGYCDKNCNNCGASRTVLLDHYYGTGTSQDSTNHIQTCTGCGITKISAHKMDGGKVTREPTCNVEGEYTYTCENCPYTKTEAIPIVHSYGDWTRVDEETHSHTCSDCQKIETQPHNWVGRLTQKPTADIPGIMTYTCSDCGASKTEEVDFILGDIDGNTTVTQDDAVYLLLYTMFGEAFYPLNGAPADIDGNGTVNQDDAVYLLLHTMFGETFYPLNTPALPAKTKE